MRVGGCGDTPSVTARSLPPAPRTLWPSAHLLGPVPSQFLRTPTNSQPPPTQSPPSSRPSPQRRVATGLSPAVDRPHQPLGSPLPSPRSHDGFRVVVCGRHPPRALCAGRPRGGGGASVGRPRGPLVHGAVQGDAVYGGAPGAQRDSRGWYVFVGWRGWRWGKRAALSLWVLCGAGRWWGGFCALLDWLSLSLQCNDLTAYPPGVVCFSFSYERDCCTRSLFLPLLPQTLALTLWGSPMSLTSSG